MKILLVNKFYYPQGGAERYLFELKSLLEKNGHQVIPFAMSDEKNVASPWEGFFVSRVETMAPRGLWQKFRTAGRMLYSWEARRKLSRLIKETKPDVAHLHNIYHQISPSILPVLKKHKIPTVMTVHDYKLICPNYILYTKGEACKRCIKGNFYNACRYRCLKDSFSASLLATVEMYFHRILNIYRKNIDLYIAPSRFVKERLMEAGFSEEKIIVQSHFAIHQELENSENLDSEKYFLYIGRLKREKGVDLLIEAMKTFPDTKLKIIGKGPDEAQLRNYVEIAKINNVKFLGHLDGQQVFSYLKNSLGLIVPSRVWETFGLSTAEAMAYGKPVIASNLGALPELVRDDETGLLFEPENTKELAEKILYLINNPADRERFGQAGYQIARDMLDPQKHYQQIVKIYEQAKK